MVTLLLLGQAARIDTNRFFVTSKMMGPIAQRPVVSQPTPQYPEMARRRGWEGQVIFRVVVSPAGGVVETQLLTSSGYQLLDWAAREALGRWQFASGDWDTGRVAFRFSFGRPRSPTLEASQAPRGKVEVSIRIKGKQGEVPKVLSAVRPDYPEALRREGIEGKVVVAVEVNQGRVTAQELAEGSGHPRLDQLAQEAMSRWKIRGTGLVVATFIFKLVD